MRQLNPFPRGTGKCLKFPAGTAIIQVANLLRRLIRESSLLTPDFDSFRSQEVTFAVWNLCLLGALVLAHVLFPDQFGQPPALVIILACAIALNAVEIVWIKSVRPLHAEHLLWLTWATILANMAVAFALAYLSYRQDIQYFALLITPVFQSAFRLSRVAALTTVAACDALIFFWVWNYFRLHPPPDLNEYIEAGVISMIYLAASVLIWTLVNHLRAKQTQLAASLTRLEETRARLLEEEKLSAVGRFSSAIAHEIRNPVAMISSALATAFSLGKNSPEGQEMFDIAAKESARLEKLTSDFLTYARPGSPSTHRADVADSIAYVGDVCRARAAEKRVCIRVDTPDGLWSRIDEGQMQQALINLVANAIDAAPPDAEVALRGSHDDGRIRIDVENKEDQIPAKTVAHMFEPFFTTKPEGTGLGLAIARGIVRGHGGELVLSRNEPGLVQFSIMLPAYTPDSEHSS